MGKRWAKGNYCDLIPDILFGVKLSNCCYTHDIYYWKKPISRKQADLRLKNCVKLKYIESGKIFLSKHIPKCIYYFLRIFGWIRWIDWKNITKEVKLWQKKSK